MNTVPFDQLGPGQSGRLAYQVLGQNGPIPNPQNIRYLPPDSSEIPSNPMVAGESGLSAGLAGANLIGSILNLGVSVYIAHRINSLHKKMDHLEEIMGRIEHKIDYIVEKVDRIDIQVAENNLRHVLNYALQKAVSPEGVNLRVLADISGDFNKFHDALSSSLLFNFGLQLSSDIRDQLQLIYELAYGIRKLITQRYNTSVKGDPERIITVTPDRDYFLIFGGDLTVHVKTTMHLPTEYSESVGWLDFDNYLPEPHYDIFEDETPEAIEQGLYDLGYAWLYQTDAGLLWRTWIELVGIVDGYENTFWPELKDAEPCGFNQIEVACDVPLLENA